MGKKYRILAGLLSLSFLWGCTPRVEDQATGAATEPTVAESRPVETKQDARAQSFGLSCQEDAGFNPYTCTRLVNRPIISLLYQGLFSVTSQYRAEPVLCQSYSCSEDLRTYLFTLATATFSDGSAVTAQDVAASLQAARGSAVYGNRLRHVTGIQADSDRSLTITLDTPYENLPVLLDIPVARQEDVEAAQPLGTGAYYLSGGAGNLRLERRSDWWSDYPAAVDFSVIQLTQCPTPSDLRDQFEFGETDLVCGDPGSAAYVDYRCDYELWDCATGIMLYLGCNQGGSSAFANFQVGAALTHGVNRSALVEIYRGFAQEAYLPASPEADCYDQSLAAKYGYDPSAFSAAVSQAGMKGTSATLLVCSDNQARVEAAQAIAGQLSDCGLQVTVNALAKEAYQQALEVGNFDFYLGEVRLSPNFDLSVFFQEGGALSYGSMTDGDVYALCLRALENGGNYYDLHQAVMDGGKLCPLLFRTYAVFSTRGTVSDLMPGLDDVFHTANSHQLSDAAVSWTGPADETQPPETTQATEATEE